MQRIIALYNNMFETNISYLSDVQTLKLAEKLEVIKEFPFDHFEYGKNLKEQKKEVVTFFDAHLTDINLDPKDVIPGLIEKLYTFGVKKKKFAYKDITLNDVFTALSITGKEETSWLFEGWSIANEYLHKQDEEFILTVQSKLENMELGDDDAEESNSANQQSETVQEKS